jgi:hypothetical protein
MATRKRINYGRAKVQAVSVCPYVDPVKQFSLECANTIFRNQEYPDVEDVIETAKEIEKFLRGTV